MSTAEIAAVATEDSPDFPVLHAIRVRGLASRDAIVEISWLCPDQVDGTLSTLAGAGLVAQRRGEQVSGWRLTTQGRRTHATAVAAQAAPYAEHVAAIFGQFLMLNSMFTQICIDWQVRPDGSPNTHDDAAYDIALLDQLTGLERRATTLTDALATILPRFGRYAPRLAAARNRLRAGMFSALTRPLSGSYHDVWMELHEDFLVTLGRRRSESDEEARG